MKSLTASFNTPSTELYHEARRMYTVNECLFNSLVNTPDVRSYVLTFTLFEQRRRLVLHDDQLFA